MKLNWQPMKPAHVSAVTSIAEVVHPGYPEDDNVLEERLALYPNGCFVLTNRTAIVGYLLSHPWIYGAPPKLNTLLKKLPEDANTYYLHDIALLPEVQGQGAVADITPQILKLAVESGFATISLCAVNQSADYWRRHGFSPFAQPDLSATLLSYGTDVTFMARPIERR